MWEAIGNAIKVFTEKHLIPTIIALVAAIGTLIALPEDYWMLAKVGRDMFFWFIAGSMFLLVQAVIALKKPLTLLRQKKSAIEKAKQEEEKAAAEGIEKFYSITENMSAQDRQTVISFIKNNNAPIVEYNLSAVNRYLYWTSLVIHIQRADGSHWVKLNNDFYQMAKNIYEAYGSITRFNANEEDE